MQQKIRKLLNPYDSSPTECDGMTRICHSVLDQHGIEHQVMVGAISAGAREMSPHFWIDLPDGTRIDYRARLWLGNEGIPHGVFSPQDFPDVCYQA